MRSPITVLSIGVSLAVIAGCSTITPTDDPVYLRLQDLEARLIRIERVMNNESLIELAAQIEQMRADTQMLRGEVETLRFETESAGSRQRELYLDIDERLQALEAGGGGFGSDDARFGGANAAGGGGGSGPANAGAASQGNGASSAGQLSGTDQDNYQAAFEMLQARRYQEAGQAFTRFLESFPESPLADNAQYWLAETYYVQQEFETALDEFQTVLEEYPQSDKLADSLLKVGYCNYELERWDAARAALQRVMREHPGTSAAQFAIQRLERLEQEAG